MPGMIQVVTGYVIVQGNTGEDVVKAVNELLVEQWQPLGAAFVVPNPGIRGDMCQTMVKHSFAQVQAGPAGRIQVPKLKIGAGG